jgi:hypothetical protein
VLPIKIVPCYSFIDNMIPTYPNFTYLDISHKEEFDNLSSEFDPYAEFSFACPFVWDTDRTAEISKYKKNLILRMPDYSTMETFTTVLGKDDIDDIFKSELTHNSLRMVPEATIQSLQNISDFFVEEDRDQFDYIYSTHDQAHLPGKHLKNRRKKSGQYHRVHDEYLIVKKLKLTNPSDINDIFQTFEGWSEHKNKKQSDVNHEREALHKLISYSSSFDFLTYGVYHDKKCVGFSINEPVQLSYVVCRFQKTLLEHNHTDAFLTNVVGIEMLYKGYNFISWEQDLGDQGLRSFKESYRPIKYLKKYKISLK